MLLRSFKALSPQDARLVSPLRLAYIGDTVWEMLIRSSLFLRGKSVHHMRQGAVNGVNAAAQAKALRGIEPMLSEDEADIARRGRNAHARHPAPRHQDPADYAAATALETLMGYLYLTAQEDRINELFAAAQEVEACQKPS